MIEVKLSNGDSPQFGSGISASSIIQELGNKAKGFVGFKCEATNKIYDLHSYIRGPITVSPIIKDSLEHLTIKRHDVSHIISSSLFNLYNAQVVNVKVNDTGLSIDFFSDTQVSENDFDVIKVEAKRLMSLKEKFIITPLNRDDALDAFEDSELIKIKINKLDDDCICLHAYHDYKLVMQGPRSLIANDKIPFEIVSISGTEWDHSNHKLQRIHITAWNTESDLKKYIGEIEESLKWDHRIIGQKMSLFNFDPSVASGMVFWLPNGAKILNKVKDYLRDVWLKNDYQEVITPVVMNSELWQKSGHMDMFKEYMMFIDLHGSQYALKPMSCPAHINIFSLGNKSYKDLPLRLSEFGLCHRYEPSGSLHGLMRARTFTQDDSHVFCSEDQIESVIVRFCSMLREVYSKFGFDNVSVCLATRPEKYIGDIESWDQAEESLMNAAKKSGLTCTINEGEGAFYGPKLEFSIKDNRKTVWQCGTVQVDFLLAKRLDADYVNKDGEVKNPVIIHHAILGSLERFLGILLENTKGLLPIWMHPRPFLIVPIDESSLEYAEKVSNALDKIGIASEIDNTDQKLGYKVRSGVEKRCIYTVILGSNEQKNGTVTLRHITGEKKEMSFDKFIALVSESVNYNNLNLNEIEPDQQGTD